MPSRLTVVLVLLLLGAPAVISWLWLVIVPVRVTKLCPEECWCDVGGYVVDCSNKSLNNIPSIYLTHVQKLLLNDNNITSLERDIFISKGLTELDNLGLDHCGLQTIELGTFNGLTKMTNLSIGKNVIGEITRRTFENMSSLEYLGLDHNKIEHLDVDVFSGLLNLLHINLKGNELLELHPDIFVGLLKLERLDLGANGGLQIPTDRHFITTHSLKFLDISDCNVSSVSVETFANVSALETLDLRYNNLRSIDINILKSLPRLSALNLYNNPLHCDCQLKKLWQRCQDRNIRGMYDLENLLCDTPKRENYRSFLLSEDLQCVQDNIRNKVEYKQIHYKHPDEENEQRYTKCAICIGIVTILLYIFWGIFGTIGNVILLIIIICNKDMRTLPNMYILNLAISDTILLTQIIATFIVGIVRILDITYTYNCTFFLFSNQMSVGLSVYSVAVLSMQRYNVTLNPFHVRVFSQETWRVTVATICGVWIVAALFSIPKALSNFDCFGLPMEVRNIAYYKRVIAFELFVFCVLPLFVIAFSYIMTARHLMKSANPVSAETQNHQLNTRRTAAKVVLGLTVVFVISYVPLYAIQAYVIFNLNSYFSLDNMIAFDDKNFNVQLTATSLFLFFLMNFSLNPVALFCTSLAFRKHFKRYICCCCKANAPPTDIELTRRN